MPMEPEDTEDRAEAISRATGISRENPGQRFAISKNNDAVGIWIEDKGLFVEVLMKAITGEWVWLVDEEDMIQTTFCNGQPLYKPEDWQEIVRVAV